MTKKMIKISDLDMSQRMVVRWRDGQRIESKATPKPFDHVRANEIYKKSGFMYRDSISDYMDDSELAYVHTVWNAIPEGSSSWMTAFFRIMNAQILDDR